MINITCVTHTELEMYLKIQDICVIKALSSYRTYINTNKMEIFRACFVIYSRGVVSFPNDNNTKLKIWLCVPSKRYKSMFIMTDIYFYYTTNEYVCLCKFFFQVCFTCCCMHNPFRINTI